MRKPEMKHKTAQPVSCYSGGVPKKKKTPNEKIDNPLRVQELIKALEPLMRSIIREELQQISKQQTAKTQKELLPLMTHEKQRHLLNLIPNEYHADASQELIDIIEHSHINTDELHLE